jgi:hypothetical protein
VLPPLLGGVHGSCLRGGDETQAREPGEHLGIWTSEQLSGCHLPRPGLVGVWGLKEAGL